MFSVISKATSTPRKKKDTASEGPASLRKERADLDCQLWRTPFDFFLPPRYTIPYSSRRRIRTAEHQNI
jgi:hypothetical protein